jgi:hypothetical protein
VAVKIGLFFFNFFLKNWCVALVLGDGVCGSGRVAVILAPLERAEQCGHFGAKYMVWLWLWRWLDGSEDRGCFFKFFFEK